ncbi:MAG: XRE family transcriptional regulator [Clostridiaceae bacterium]|nr:XRE family transcriptional regulator [Clostridiaceae bacterium]
MNKKKTNELLEILQNTDTRTDLNDYLSHMDNSQTFSQYLSVLMKEKNLDKSKVIHDSDIQRTYGYQILDGTRKPGREKVIALCLGMHLTLEETQRALTLSGNGILYAKNARDSILIFCIHKGFSLMETNELLYEEGKATLE